MLAACHLVHFLTLCFFSSFLSCAEYFPGYSTAANQVVEAHREARRQAGVEIAPNARRSLEEQLLAIQARLQPAHRMLRRLQRVGAQVLAALWPGEVVPRTPSRTADWLEVAVGRFEAWKASAARSGARRALEFVKAWYPELSLDQLATWRQEADTELEPARPAIIQRASAIADYTDTNAFAPEVDDNGLAQLEEWFGLNQQMARTRRRRSTPATRARRRRRMVKTPCQMVEQPASLSLTVPPATRRVRAHRLQPAMIKPRLASRPLLQPALPSPPTGPTRLLRP